MLATHSELPSATAKRKITALDRMHGGITVGFSAFPININRFRTRQGVQTIHILEAYTVKRLTKFAGLRHLWLERQSQRTRFASKVQSECGLRQRCLKLRQ